MILSSGLFWKLLRLNTEGGTEAILTQPFLTVTKGTTYWIVMCKHRDREVSQLHTPVVVYMHSRDFVDLDIIVHRNARLSRSSSRASFQSSIMSSFNHQLEPPSRWQFLALISALKTP